MAVCFLLVVFVALANASSLKKGEVLGKKTLNVAEVAKKVDLLRRLVESARLAEGDDDSNYDSDSDDSESVSDDSDSESYLSETDTEEESANDHDKSDDDQSDGENVDEKEHQLKKLSADECVKDCRLSCSVGKPTKKTQQRLGCFKACLQECL